MGVELRAARLLSRLHAIRPRRARRLTAALRRDHRRTAEFGWGAQLRGIGVGTKVTGDERTAQPCVTFYVNRKRPLAGLAAEARIPPRLWLDGLDATVLTDVVPMRGRPRAHAAALIRPGYEVAHAIGAPGTMGLLVRKLGASTRYAVGCSHVLALGGAASVGDVVETPYSTDPNPSLHQFGTLDTFTTLSATGTFREDFAIAAVSVLSSPRFFPQGVVPSTIYDAVNGFGTDMETELQGFVSRKSRGQVVDGNWSGGIDVPGVGTVHFSGLVLYETECAEGDSGAAILRVGTSEVLGLHVGGTKSSGWQQAFFMPISPVFDRLSLRLVV